MGKHHKSEEIIPKLQQAKVLMGQSQPVAEAVRAIGVTETTYYRWRSECGGLKLDPGDFAAQNAEVRRLKLLEQENMRLRRAEVFYNRQQLHLSLGYCTPAEARAEMSEVQDAHSRMTL